MLVLNRIWSYFALVHIYAAVAIFATTVVFCLFAYGGIPDAVLLLRVVGVVSLAQACVGITNELIDLPRDRQVKPDRPLVNGQADPRLAYIIAITTGTSSLLLSLTFGWVGLIFAILGLGSGLAYDFWFKGTALSWLPYTIGFSLLPLWPFAALDVWNPTLALIWLPALPASIALNVSQSLSDIDEDQHVGFGGITRRLGTQWSLLLLWACCALMILLGIVTVFPTGFTPLFLVSISLSTLLVLIAAWRCHYHPGPTAWQWAWYLVAASVSVLGIGWFNAVLYQ